MAALHDLIAVVYAAKWYIAALALFAYGLQSYLSYRRLAHIKGPFWAALTNLWLVRSAINKATHEDLYDINKKYGTLARIGPNMLVTCDADIIYRMNAARSPYTKGTWYTGWRFQPGLDSVFSSIDEKEHTKRRGQMALGYSGKENPGVEKRVDQHMLNLIKLIRRKYISTSTVFKPMDLARKLQFVTLDIISDLAYDAPFGDLEKDEDVHLYLKAGEENLPIAILLSTIPAIRDFTLIPLVAGMILPSSKGKTGLGKLIGMAEDVVKKRYKEDPEGKQMDMLGSFMRHGMEEVNAISETIIQIMAGSDTTATGMRATMLFIMTNPRVYHRLQTEIDNHVKSISLPRTQIISQKMAETLPYLHAVIREGLRIWVPAVGLAPKTTPPEGDTLNGIFVPGGTEIGYNAWGLARNTEVFGDDADIFRPERWLEAQGETLARMERMGDLLFGYGKYQCLGQTLAWMELNKVFFELLRNFEFSIVDPTRPWTSACVALWLQKDLWVRVSEREERM